MSESKKLYRKNKITVFYDGMCGLCSREIEHYKKVAPQDIFDWIDITKDPETFEKLGYSKEEGLKALHVKDADGSIHVAVDAFIVIWQQLKNWRLLAKFAKLPVIKKIADFFYRHFANWRFKKLGH